MTKTAIITGVTGQMGSHFADFLLAKGFKVIGTVRRLSVSNHKNIEHVKSNPFFTLAPMDLSDAASINALVERYKPDYFINCSANSFVGSSWDFPEQHMDLNCLGVLRQLEAIKRFSPTTRYVNFGSSEEMGDVLYSPQDEKHPPRARSPYSVSKIAARQMVKVYRESFGLYAIQCWCFNYEGIRRGAEFLTRKVTLGVARIAHAIRAGKPFDPIELGNIDSRRDWSEATDVMEGVWLMLNQDVTAPQEYVLASGETHSVREFVELAFKEAGIAGEWENRDWQTKCPEAEVYAMARQPGQVLPSGCCTRALVSINPKFYRPADVELLWGDATKARQELGWSPKVSFPELVKRMVRHDIENYKP